MAETFDSDSQFCRLRAGHDDVDLVRVMLELAADSYPDLDPSVCLATLDELAARVHDALDSDVLGGALRGQLTVVSRVLHREEGFRGDLDNYYDPRNSYLNEVLARRRGIPITLSIVYQAVANRAGIPVYGVGTPGHFVVGCRSGNETWYVDPFALGEVLSFEECRRRIEKNLGQSGVLTPDDFQPASAVTIVARVLRNLKSSLARDNDWPHLYRVQRRLAWLLHDEPDEQRDLGLVCLRVGDGRQALQLFRQYVERCDEPAREVIAPYLKIARRMVAEMN